MKNFKTLFPKVFADKTVDDEVDWRVDDERKPGDRSDPIPNILINATQVVQNFESNAGCVKSKKDKNNPE